MGEEKVQAPTEDQPTIPPVDPREDPLDPPILPPEPPVPPRIRQDRFLHLVPNGDLDILFIFHNRKKMIPVINKLKEVSSPFLNALIDFPHRSQYGGKLIFKISVISSNSSTLLHEGITPTNAFEMGTNLLDEVLKKIPIEGGENENLTLDKILDVTASGFLRGGVSRFFPIILSNADYTGKLNFDSVLKQIEQIKPKYLFHAMGMFFLEGSDNCNDFSGRRAILLRQFVERSNGDLFELCEFLKDPAQIIERVLFTIYQEMTRKILSFRPYPDSIKVYLNAGEVSRHAWIYDPVKNEILMSESYPYSKMGDPIDVVYQIRQ